MKWQAVLKKIKKHDLQPATRRELTLFGASCVLQAYVELLTDFLGFSYQAAGILGDEHGVIFLFNEDRLARLVGAAVRRDKEAFVAQALGYAQKIHKTAIPQLMAAMKSMEDDPESFLSTVIIVYPRYMAGMGIYNSFWRFVGNDKSKLEPRLVRLIGARRDKVAAVYPKVEESIRIATRLLEKDTSVHSRFFGCLTAHEMESFLENRKLPVNQESLRQRAEGYIYFLDNDSENEIVISGRESMQALRKQVLVPTGSNELQGQVGYPGRVRGVVYTLQNKKTVSPPKNFILVASSTHPNEIVLIKKSAAIVTNEGGILCHAAIVARELKIPCVIGTKRATDIFKDGDLVEVDANIGVIRKIVI